MQALTISQLNCVKEMSLAETAEGFQGAGYNVLLYDSRNVGGSGGMPRNQIEPLRMAEDISGSSTLVTQREERETVTLLTFPTIDVVTYAATLPSVDPRRILLWGMSLGGTISACAAAVDRRVAAVLMVCPIFKFIRPDKRTKAFGQLMRDRSSQLRGNEPFTLQPFNSKGENPIG